MKLTLEQVTGISFGLIISSYRILNPVCLTFDFSVSFPSRIFAKVQTYFEFLLASIADFIN